MSMPSELDARAVQTLKDDFEQQRLAYCRNPYPGWLERRQRLRSLKALLRENKASICQAIDRDFNGRSEQETLSAEYLQTLRALNHSIRHTKRWMRSRRVVAPFIYQPVKAQVMPQPLGVIGIVVPWNYPLLLSLGPLISALAAGNHAMIKLSEHTPHFGQLLIDLIPRYFDQTIVNAYMGNAEYAQSFSLLAFDHLLFTGSAAIGREVMKAASAHLTPVTLELGGKNPAVIDRSIPIQEAARRLVYPKCLNSGQTCVAPDYVLCPEELVDDFVLSFQEEVARQYGDVTYNQEYSAIINQRHRQRLVSYVEEAIQEGARVYVAGPTDDLSSYNHKLPPILLTQVSEGCLVLRDEIFGPVLPVVSYRQVEDALEYINHREKPLAIYVFGYQHSLRPQFSQLTHSGALLFNEALIHVGMDNLPFGGVGASGMGHYHGHYGFETFSKLKTIVSKQRFSSLKWVYPPYENRFLLKLLNRYYR